jgi:hypothetical protein
MSDIAGRIFPTPPALRYVVLRHEGVDDPHFDLMFETSSGSALATWRSPRWPIESDTSLTKLADHRRAYLDYEGPVSDNRGHVRRITSGFYRLERASSGATWIMTFRDTLGHSQLQFTRDAADRWTARPHHRLV